MTGNRRAALARYILPVAFSLLWIVSLPHLAIGLSPRLLRVAALGQWIPNFGGLALLWLARRPGFGRNRRRRARATLSSPK